MLGELLAAAGRIDEGLAAVDAGMAHAERFAENGYVAELHRARGRLLRLAGNDAGAEASLREALDYAAGQQAKSFELRAATQLAELLTHRDRPQQAREIPAPIYGWFTEGHATADLTAARRLLDRLD